MKKILFELTILMLMEFILCFMFCDNLKSKNTYYCDINQVQRVVLATEEDYDIQYSSFMQAYFDNLKYNFGMNYQGSCGYVAASMLLSYYDTFLSDRIVPENYDINSISNTYDIYSRFNSPGTLKDIISLPSNPNYASYGYEMGSIDYYEKVYEMSNMSLHSKLITIGESLGFYNYEAEINHYCSSSLNEIWDVLDEYLGDILFTSSHYEIIDVLPSSSEDVRNFVIEKIELGYPVYLTVRDDDSGHAVVAYDYDETNDLIYVHMGYDSESTHVTPESEGYNEYTGAFIIDWSIDHEHSNNYGVYSNDGTEINYYCYDNPLLSILSHVCYYDAGYESNNFRNHKVKCKCGNYYNEPHTIIENECVKCDYGHIHNYVTSYYNENYHQTWCTCGYTVLQYHIVNNENLEYCVVCNTEITNNYNLLSGGVKFIGVNGSYKLPNGIVILSSSDYKKYMTEKDLHFF